MEDQEDSDSFNFSKKDLNMKLLKETEKFLWEENYLLKLQKSQGRESSKEKEEVSKKIEADSIDNN